MPITSIISLNQLINWFQLFQQNHYFLKDFGFGEPYDIGTSRQMTFPYMWVTMNEDSSIATGSNNKSAIPDISFSIMFMDKINIQENYLDTNGFPSDNSQEILSDTLQCLQDLVTMIQQNWGQYGVLISQDVSFYPAVDETQDKSTGVVGRFVLRTRQVNCIIPENPYFLTPTPTPTNTPTPTVTPTPTPTPTATIGACSGSPLPGPCIATPSSGTSGVSVILSLTNILGSGTNYLWQSGPSATGPWMSLGFNAPSFFTSVQTTTWFRCSVTCTNSGLTTIATPVGVTII